MRRVLRELRRVRKSADVDAVHDLRVAIRRCRSVAAIMEEVDAHPAWRELRRLPRKLFRTLGALRDLQVLEQWVKRLAAADDPLRPKLLNVLEDCQTKPRQRVLRVAHAFDEDGWKRLAHTLARRARLVEPNSLTAKCLALERYEELRSLHTRAVRTEAPEPWHALRIGLKRFRYTVESLLPDRSAVWDESLGQMQGLLGGIHDLDVLKTWITQHTGGAGAGGSLRHAVQAQRKSCIEQYREDTSGPAGLLQVWKAGLTHQTTIAALTAGRLRTTARAMDPHPDRTAEISRLALQIFDRLAASGTEPQFRDEKLRVILRTAAQLHAIRGGDRRGSRHKVARDILRGVPLPLGWTSQDWDLLTHVVRYQRGAEPTARHKHFGRLSGVRRDRVRGLAGVLRLARVLRLCGSTSTQGVRTDETPVCVRLRAARLTDTMGNAARLAGAKHLLESYLRCPIVIEPTHTAKAALLRPLPVANAAESAGVARPVPWHLVPSARLRAR